MRLRLLSLPPSSGRWKLHWRSQEHRLLRSLLQLQEEGFFPRSRISHPASRYLLLRQSHPEQLTSPGFLLLPRQRLYPEHIASENTRAPTTSAPDSGMRVPCWERQAEESWSASLPDQARSSYSKDVTQRQAHQSAEVNRNSQSLHKAWRS